MKLLNSILVFATEILCLPPLLGTIIQSNDNSYQIGSKSNIYLVSPEYLTFISEYPSLKKNLDVFFEDAQICWETPIIRFLDFHYSPYLNVSSKDMNIDTSLENEDDLLKDRGKLKFELVDNFFQILFKRCYTTSSILKLVKNYHLTNSDKIHQYFDLNLNCHRSSLPPVKTLRFLHDLIDLMFEKSSFKTKIDFNCLSLFTDLFETIYDTPNYNNEVSFIRLLHHLAILSDEFFINNHDSSPHDIFSKFIFLAQTAQYFFHYDKESSTLVLSNNKIDSLVKLLDREYESFMEILRDQFRIHVINYIYYYENKEEVFQKFKFNHTVMSVIHALMSLLCNFSKILNNQPLKIYSLNHDYLIDLELNEKIENRKYSDDNLSIFGEKSGIITQEITIEDFTELFFSNLGLLTILPLSIKRGKDSKSPSIPLQDSTSFLTFENDQFDLSIEIPESLIF